MGHALIADILIALVNILNKVPVFWHQLLLQNISFMSLVTKLTWAILKQKIDTIVKNPYFKLSANNITFSILEGFSLEKIESNIKADAFFLDSLIREISDVDKVKPLMVTRIFTPLLHYWWKVEKIAIFDIARRRMREMFILDIPKARTILLINSVLMRTQIKVVTIVTLILTLIW